MLVQLCTTLGYIFSHPLGRLSKWRSTIAFIRWQIGVRMLKGSVLIDWVDDTKMLAMRGEPSFTGNIYCGLMEFQDMAFLMHFLRSEEHFFDIGGNVGTFSILASGVAGANSTTFEPVPETFEMLVDQIRVNRLESLIQPLNVGVSDRPGKLRFTKDLNGANRVATTQDGSETVEVETITLDAAKAPSAVTVVKIDVEGFEGHVIAGGEAFFANENVRVVIIETNGSCIKYGYSDKQIDMIMRNHGFVSVRYNPFTRSIAITDSFQFGKNTIYLKDVEEAQLRCRSAAAFILHTHGGRQI